MALPEPILRQLHDLGPMQELRHVVTDFRAYRRSTHGDWEFWVRLRGGIDLHAVFRDRDLFGQALNEAQQCLCKCVSVKLLHLFHEAS